MGKRRDEDSSSSESDESSSDGDSDDGSSSGSSESDGSSSGISDYSTDSNGSAGSGSDDENFEVGFWQSIKAVLPWTEEAKEVKGEEAQSSLFCARGVGPCYTFVWRLVSDMNMMNMDVFIYATQSL